MKAEQNKQPATPLLGRKVFPDTTDFSPRPSPLVQQPVHEKSETKMEQKDSLTVPNGVQVESHRTRAERGEARVGYVRQEMKPERLQPKIDHVEAKITEKIQPTQEGTRGERAEKVAQGMATLTVEKAEGKSSRHGERRRERHDRRLERQESSEKEVPKPEHVEERKRRDRHDKRLERQGSSEQETPKQEPTERRRDRHEKRGDKQESSEQETPKIEPDRQGG